MPIPVDLVVQNESNTSAMRSGARLEVAVARRDLDGLRIAMRRAHHDVPVLPACLVDRTHAIGDEVEQGYLPRSRPAKRSIDIRCIVGLDRWSTHSGHAGPRLWLRDKWFAIAASCPKGKVCAAAKIDILNR